MSISAISGNIQSWQTTTQQRRQDLAQIGSALQQGDISAAQKAFSDLQSLNGSNVASSSSDSNETDTASKDFAALGQALQSGNVSDAQNAFTKLQSDIQTHKGGHRHHHHANGSDSNGQQNNVSNDFSALGQALQSGNLADAQSAFAKIQSDLQSKYASYTQQGSMISSNTSNTEPAKNSTVNTIA